MSTRGALQEICPVDAAERSRGPLRPSRVCIDKGVLRGGDEREGMGRSDGTWAGTPRLAHTRLRWLCQQQRGGGRQDASGQTGNAPPAYVVGREYWAEGDGTEGTGRMGWDLGEGTEKRGRRGRDEEMGRRGREGRDGTEGTGRYGRRRRYGGRVLERVPAGSGEKVFHSVFQDFYWRTTLD
ncbi:hypothetical protein AK812_SmicGene6340 [Symbiodinium microadriaticum]|uniref:Uncharacterized protein n=1 Tax=Symbiodinium microadriaticum TaxID=2951 RepID=A0A1Q9ERC9_SYMMI|nr:hypothetical protein AK812_SmicGene6340 [Symbiodinium microadriaticum]